ncbi:MAG: prepilin-type N-terminal cleavage/methylation domain-containing protein [Candidatus Omnitrophica bacterium]|nr:prepilin-type N-terminal cleavage/methylation domain-containing protein [Candidatus Omnitrophota bacterium]
MPGKLRGMTLVEVMIVIVIMVTVSVAVFNTMNGGFALWDRVLTLKHEEDIDIAFDKMTSDLGKVARFSFIGFQGQENALSFPVMADGFEDKGQLTGLRRIARVSYSMDTLHKVLLRSETRFEDTFKSARGYERTLLKDVVRVEFRYFCRPLQGTGLVERLTVKKGDAIPHFVQVNLIVEGTDRRYDRITQLIEVPIAKTI